AEGGQHPERDRDSAQNRSGHHGRRDVRSRASASRAAPARSSRTRPSAASRTADSSPSQSVANSATPSVRSARPVVSSHRPFPSADASGRYRLADRPPPYGTSSTGGPPAWYAGASRARTASGARTHNQSAWVVTAAARGSGRNCGSRSSGARQPLLT